MQQGLSADEKLMVDWLELQNVDVRSDFDDFHVHGPGRERLLNHLRAEDARKKAQAQARRMRLLRTIGRVAGKLIIWHKRAAERAYAPGGLGFEVAREDFADHVQRWRR